MIFSPLISLDRSLSIFFNSLKISCFCDFLCDFVFPIIVQSKLHYFLFILGLFIILIKVEAYIIDLIFSNIISKNALSLF